MNKAHWFSLRGRRAIRFFGMVVALCLLAALATLGVRWLLTAVALAKPIGYEQVDVRPQEVSPRHQKERDEYERRDRAVTEQNQ